MIDNLAASGRASGSGGARRSSGSRLDRTRQLAGIREMPKNYMVLTLGAARRDLLAVGEVLAAAGPDRPPR